MHRHGDVSLLPGMGDCGPSATTVRATVMPAAEFHSFLSTDFQQTVTSAPPCGQNCRT